jgi:hypothetical protein
MAQPEFADLYRAYQACRRRKRGTPEAQRYESRLLDHLIESVAALRSRRWRPGRSVSFVVRRPKAREIHAAPFAERVVHHYLTPRLEALYEPVFIHDVYSNRRGKGIHAAVRRLQYFMRRCQTAAAAAPGAGRGWYLQLDIQNFFNSIDRARLLELLERRLDRCQSPWADARPGARGLDQADAGLLRDLCRALLTTDPGANVHFRGPPAERARVPAHKRLGALGPGLGLPIGNLCSQFFANVYLNELDHYVKHVLRCRDYLRYVDDFILLHPDPAVLLDWKAAIEDFLAERLALKLKPDYRLHPVANGADFLGYIVRPGYLLARRRVVGHLREALRDWAVRHGLSDRAAPFRLTLEPADGERLRARLASYLGHLGHACHFRRLHALFREFPWLAQLFAPPAPPHAAGGAPFRLLPRWPAPASANSLPAQWRYFRRGWPGAAVWLQAGHGWYLFDADAVALAAPLGRPLLTEPPFGMRDALAVPLAAAPRWRQRLERLGQPQLWVAEAGRQRPGLQRRVARHWSLCPPLSPTPLTSGDLS